MARGESIFRIFDEVARLERADSDGNYTDELNGVSLIWPEALAELLYVPKDAPLAQNMAVLAHRLSALQPEIFVELPELIENAESATIVHQEGLDDNLVEEEQE